MGIAHILGATAKQREILCVNHIKGTKTKSQIKIPNDKYNTLDYSDITHKSKKIKIGRKVNQGCCIQLENSLCIKNKRNSALFKKAEYSPLEKMLSAGAGASSKYMFSKVICGKNRQNSDNQEGSNENYIQCIWIYKLKYFWDRLLWINLALERSPRIYPNIDCSTPKEAQQNSTKNWKASSKDIGKFSDL